MGAVIIPPFDGFRAKIRLYLGLRDGGQQLDFFVCKSASSSAITKMLLQSEVKQMGCAFQILHFLYYYIFAVAQEESTMETKRSFACTKQS